MIETLSKFPHKANLFSFFSFSGQWNDGMCFGTYHHAKFTIALTFYTLNMGQDKSKLKTWQKKRLHQTQKEAEEDKQSTYLFGNDITPLC